MKALKALSVADDVRRPTECPAAAACRASADPPVREALAVYDVVDKAWQFPGDHIPPKKR